MQPPMAPPSMPAQQQDYGGDMPFPAVKLRGLPFDVEPIAIARFLVRYVDCSAVECIFRLATVWLRAHACVTHNQYSNSQQWAALRRCLLPWPH